VQVYKLDTCALLGSAAVAQHIHRSAFERRPFVSANNPVFTVNSKFTNTVDITLPASGSLAPLFNAFGLIENEELDIQQAVDPGRLQQTCLQKHVLLNFIRLMMLHVVQTFMLLLWL